VKLILFTTKVDKGGQIIKREAERMFLSCQIYFYDELTYQDGQILNLSQDSLFIEQDDKIILRDPYNSTSNYSFFTQKILKKYYKNVALDRECYSKFPFYEDKLFQVDLFNRLRITTPNTFLGKNVSSFQKFPVIIKPRIGSRGRGIRIFNKLKEIETFLAKKDPLDFIIQKYHKAKSEYRILIFRYKVLGVVDKHIFLKGKGNIGVRVNKVVEDFPRKIKEDSIKITKRLKADFVGVDSIKITKRLKADFVGVDVIHAVDGKYYFLEANLSPQFGGFAKATKINVASMVIRSALA